MVNDINKRCAQLRYVLITPARNEEAFIERTVQSVIHQTVLPAKWVIVDDGSTDATARIVGQYLARYDWIEMIRMPPHRDRSFAAKVHCFNAAHERLKDKDIDYDIIGNLDADVSFAEDHFGFLLGKFEEDLDLGVAGTIFKEEGYSSDIDSFEGQDSVTGACQLFRRRCFEEIGGYIPNKAGGIDWIAVTAARMIGWKTRSFREKSLFHYRRAGTAERGILAAAFSAGAKDYYLGGRPAWEFFRVAYRMTKRPYLLAGIALGLGYSWAFLRRIERPVSDELMRFHRREQMLKLKAILKSLLSRRRLDSFRVAPR
jgi:glycosyltransferase involved in cell wall biosynthesis